MGLGTNTPLVGCIRAYAGAVTDSGAQEVPTSGSGWLYCNGAAVSRTTYDDLFAQIGTTYGAGDGSTTFNLPDMRGCIPVGLNLVVLGHINSGTKGGTATHTISSAEMPTHSHTITLTGAGSHSHTGTSSSQPQGQHTYYLGSPTPIEGGAGASKSIGVEDTPTSTGFGPTGNGVSVNHSHTFSFAADSTHAAAHTLTIPAEGGGGAHNNLPPYLALNFVVKY